MEFFQNSWHFALPIQSTNLCERSASSCVETLTWSDLWGGDIYIKKLQPVECNLKDIMFPNKQWQIRGAKVKATVWPVIIYCAWPEDPEIGTSCGSVTTYQDLGTGEKQLQCVGTLQALTQAKEGCCFVENDRGDTRHKSIGKQFFLDFLCPGNISLVWIRTWFT